MSVAFRIVSGGLKAYAYIEFRRVSDVIVAEHDSRGLSKHCLSECIQCVPTINHRIVTHGSTVRRATGQGDLLAPLPTGFATKWTIAHVSALITSVHPFGMSNL